MEGNTNPTDLNLTFTPPAIGGFDYAALEAWARNIAAQYQGLIVTEDQAIGIKSEMAHLNATKKKLDDARKEAVKLVSAPIKEFEAQIKAVCAIFDETYSALGAQVKDHEDRAREQKRTEVQFMIEAVTAEQGYPCLAIPIQDSWLNKSKPMKTVKAEVEAIILAHIKAERDAAALEQAKQDRAVAIEQHSAGQAQAFGFNIPPSQFLNLQDLAIPLGDVLTRINAAYTLKAEAMARENVAPVSTATASGCPLEGKLPGDRVSFAGAVEHSPARKSLSVRLEFDAAREGEVNMALRHLESIGISVTRTTSTTMPGAIPPHPPCFGLLGHEPARAGCEPTPPHIPCKSCDFAEPCKAQKQYRDNLRKQPIPWPK
jgi:hypothetical protein